MGLGTGHNSEVPEHPLGTQLLVLARPIAPEQEQEQE